MSLTPVYFHQDLIATKQLTKYVPLGAVVFSLSCVDLILITSAFSIVQFFYAPISGNDSAHIDLMYVGFGLGVVVSVTLKCTNSYADCLQKDVRFATVHFPIVLLTASALLGFVGIVAAAHREIFSAALVISVAAVLCVAWPIRSKLIGVLRARIRAGKLATSRAVLFHDIGPDGERDVAAGALDALTRSGIEVERVERVRLRNGAHSLDLLQMLQKSCARTPWRWRLNAVYFSADRVNDLQLQDLRDELGPLPVPVYVIARFDVQSTSTKDRISDPSGIAFRLQRARFAGTDFLVKRIFDVVLSAVLIILLMPLFALVATAIKIDSPGPILFRQSRRGLNGQAFKILKFRSMHVLEDGSAIQQAKRNDIRVTRLGGLLRQTSIDELPQLINVFLGHMSLVGPRPHAIAHDDYYGNQIPSYNHRQRLKPGITGWAQVSGFRGATPHLQDMMNRIDCDNWYIAHWSLSLDIKIIIRTALLILNDRKAY